MKSRLLLLLLLLPGCSPAINAELSLIDQSKRAVAAIDVSLKDRETIAQQDFDARRARLDAAFDADVANHANELSTQWVTDARNAYSTAIDALNDAKQKSQQAAQTDQDNLDAVKTALDELATLNQAQLNWAPFKETK